MYEEKINLKELQNNDSIFEIEEFAGKFNIFLKIDLNQKQFEIELFRGSNEKYKYNIINEPKASTSSREFETKEKAIQDAIIKIETYYQKNKR